MTDKLVRRTPMLYDTSAKAFLAERKLNGSLVLKMTAEEQKALNRNFILWRRSRELANHSAFGA